MQNPSHLPVDSSANSGTNVHFLQGAERQVSASEAPLNDATHADLHHRLLKYLGVFTLSSLGTVMEIKHLLPHIIEPFNTHGWNGLGHIISGADHLMFSWASMTALFLAAISVPTLSALGTIRAIWKLFGSKRAWAKSFTGLV